MVQIVRVKESVVTPAEKNNEPALGTDVIPKEKYYSKEFMDMEWERLWTKVWLMGPRLSELPEVGDYLTEQHGRESVLFVRGRDEKVRAFYNVCQHRGNKVKFDREGTCLSLQCAYHYWEWNLEGGLEHVPDEGDFPQGAPKDKLGLKELQTDTWGGFVWFTFNKNAEPLLDFLDPIPQHLDPYHFENMAMVNNQTINWDCNWKTSVDAFNEVYHVQAIHPELIYFLDDRDVQIDLYERHNRYLVPFQTYSPRIEDPDEVPEMIAMSMQAIGMDPAKYRGKVEKIRRDMQVYKRKNGKKMGYDYSDFNDDQLTDDYHYFIFPNLTMNIHAESMMLFRQRPHPTDPDKMYFDLQNFVAIPKGAEAPEQPEHSQHNHGEVSLGLVLDQDAFNLPNVQQGMKSDGFAGLWISGQERRIRHFHKVIDGYVYGKGANDR